MEFSRRGFLITNVKAGIAIGLQPFKASHTFLLPQSYTFKDDQEDPYSSLDLSPAQWVWPSVGRTLPNTVVMFRKTFSIINEPFDWFAFIHADSRYRLWINGQYIGFGPAPYDPRYPEVDKINLTGYLKTGDNCIGVEILYYGHGDGTWPTGVPGFIMKLTNGSRSFGTDTSWSCKIANAWPAGKYKRWYLRAFQEEFDARKYPYGWSLPDFNDGHWDRTDIISGSSPKEPVIASNSKDYLTDSGGTKAELRLIERQIPLLDNTKVSVESLREAFLLEWKVEPTHFFDFDLDEEKSFGWQPYHNTINEGKDSWRLNTEAEKAYALTFDFKEQIVGFPYFSIKAPEGTTVELLVHESHAVDGTHRLLNTHFNSWSRFICKEGWNTFQTFDFESVKWLQLHIRNTKGIIVLEKIGVLRRTYPFVALPKIITSDEKYNTVLEACTNTILNQSQDLIVDGMGRERQQYSNDVGHVIHALSYGFNANELIARYCNTYSQGITEAGYFLDCWPAFDRLTRIYQREIGITPWGPLVDHGIGFVFDCNYYYQYTGNLSQLKFVYPRIKRFYQFLENLIVKNGLAPVEDLGIPVVWIDHLGYKQQKHKHCAFNMFLLCMLKHALAPLARAFGDYDFAVEVDNLSNRLLKRVKEIYWSIEAQSFVSNLPWATEENEIRYDERSLSLAVLYDLVPKEKQDRMISLLKERPISMGQSFATNAVWRYWALGKVDETDTLLKEFTNEWYRMPSVLENNTLGEFFDLKYDDNSQWSHASVAPLICFYINILGLKPLVAGFDHIEIKPRLGNLDFIKGDIQTPKGPISFNLRKNRHRLVGTIKLPKSISATFINLKGVKSTHTEHILLK